MCVVYYVEPGDWCGRLERREDALFYRRLATLIDTVPLAESLDDLEFRGVPRGRFEAWCDGLGVSTLKTAPRRWAP